MKNIKIMLTKDQIDFVIFIITIIMFSILLIVLCIIGYCDKRRRKKYPLIQYPFINDNV